MKKAILPLLAFILLCAISGAQPVPGVDENIPNLVTFGSQGETGWGDDNFTQIIFFAVPEDYAAPVYIRVFDPDVGGENDEQKGEWDTRMRYSIYGGKGSCSSSDAKKGNVDGDYLSGTMLASKSFGENERYDLKWYTFGPINPDEGEYLPEFGGYIFKIVIEGVSGDDGNLYRLFLSSENDRNHKAEGAFAYYFKYKFRMHDDRNEISHIYPYIDDKVISIKQTNFDWDNDGYIKIISCARKGEYVKISADDTWNTSTHKILEAEKNTSLNIQMIKNRAKDVKSNNVVIFLENQYGELLPFYSVPIGGVPKYSGKIKLTPKK
ncbi:MAG: hypothetical protein JEZ14_15805 [Marinilabiliaceae bacterium]|nr:hypothetical protein [Marinilabiliaceae bacterium]